MLLCVMTLANVFSASVMAVFDLTQTKSNEISKELQILIGVDKVNNNLN